MRLRQLMHVTLDRAWQPRGESSAVTRLKLAGTIKLPCPSTPQTQLISTLLLACFVPRQIEKGTKRKQADGSAWRALRWTRVPDQAVSIVRQQVDGVLVSMGVRFDMAVEGRGSSCSNLSRRQLY